MINPQFGQRNIRRRLLGRFHDSSPVAEENKMRRWDGHERLPLARTGAEADEEEMRPTGRRGITERGLSGH